MERLSIHIEYLLLRHDCVVVPGFGAFINARSEARVDSESGQVYPMMREVRFNSALVHDDGLLAGSFARKYRVPFAEGREMLRKSIESLRRTMASDGEVTIGRIGIISSESDTLSFVPMHGADDEAAHMGYHPVSWVRTAADDAMTDVIADNTTEREDKVSDPGTRIRRFDTRRNYYIAVNKRFARTSACFLLVAAVALSLFLPSHDRTVMPDQASVLPVENIIRKVENSASGISNEKENEVSDTLSGPIHYLVVGTFETEEEADRFIAMRQDCGYELESVGGKRLWRVSAVKDSDRKNLANILNSKEFSETFKEAWIWSK